MSGTASIVRTVFSELQNRFCIGSLDIEAEQHDEIEALEECIDLIQTTEIASGQEEQYLEDEGGKSEHTSSIISDTFDQRPDFAALVKGASAEVVVKSTRDEYERLVTVQLMLA